MAVMTEFSASHLSRLLGHYDVGELVRFGGLPEGSIQTNLWVQTTRGRYAFRYYEEGSRARAETQAEIQAHLSGARFPCPAPIPGKGGGYVGTHRGKPYSLFTFLEGGYVERLSLTQVEQVAGLAAELHLITEGYRPRRATCRNYRAAFRAEEAQKEAEAIGTPEAAAELEWLKAVLERLVLPRSLPKGLCHGDLMNPSNLLFLEGRLAGLLDWDDANSTYLIFDLAHLLDWHCWRNGGEFPFFEARQVIRAYEARRKLRAVERWHLYDVCKLEILVDCWWWSRWEASPDSTAKRMIGALEAVGREGFYARVFG